jgi:hypothetical protein
VENTQRCSSCRLRVIAEAENVSNPMGEDARRVSLSMTEAAARRQLNSRLARLSTHFCDRGGLTTIFFANGIGDALLCLPTVRALSAVLEGRIWLVHAPPGSAFLFNGIRVHRRVALQSVSSPGIPSSFDVADLIKELDVPDSFVSLVNWQSEQLGELITALSPVTTVGWGPMFQWQLPWNETVHVADILFSVVRHLDPRLSLRDFWGFPELPPRNRETGAVFRRNLPRGAKVLAVHADTLPKKSWTSECLAEVIGEFLRRHPEFLILLLGKNSEPAAGCMNEGRVLRGYGIPLATSFSLLAESDLFLGVDSCLLHAADLLSVPGVGLFGPTKARRWGFRFAPSICIQAAQAMSEIRPPLVLQQLERVLSGSSVPQPEVVEVFRSREERDDG